MAKKRGKIRCEVEIEDVPNACDRLETLKQIAEDTETCEMGASGDRLIVTKVRKGRKKGLWLVGLKPD